MKQDKQKKLTSIIALIVAALLILGSLSSLIFLPSYASSNLQNKLNNAKKERQAAAQQLQNIQAKKDNATAQKKQIDKEIAAVQADISVLEDQIAKSNAKIQKTQLELNTAQEKCDEQEDAFKVRARAMYKSGSATYLEVLFSSTSFSDFISNIEITKRIMDYDKKILDERIASRKVIEDALLIIEQEKEAIELSKQTLDEKKAALNTKRQAQNVLISQLSDEIEKYKKEVAEKQAEADRIQSQINAALASQPSTSSQTTGTGSWTWPCPSSRTLTSYFGYRMHPVYKVQKYHSGIDIAAAHGVPVVAAQSGTVMFSGYSSSYGYYIVLSHGNNTTSLYAHNSSLLVKSGQTVTRGQQIAKVGSTGVSTGPHCHFEVSVNGQRVDPLSYVR